jgi:hypothetical protein
MALFPGPNFDILACSVGAGQMREGNIPNTPLRQALDRILAPASVDFGRELAIFPRSQRHARQRQSTPKPNQWRRLLPSRHRDLAAESPRVAEITVS